MIDEKHQFVTEIWRAKRRSDNGIQGPDPNRIDLRGPGVFPDYHGACAYGGSCTAGLIRTGEITHGIHHALRVSLAPEVMNPTAPDGKPYVWPANNADANLDYSSNGNIYMGSLLAIPPTVDVAKVFGPKGSSKYNLAKAMQDYGLYVVDRGWFNIYGDQGAAKELQQFHGSPDFGKYLQVVTNNGSNSVGGGGTPRAPLAPPAAD